MARAVSITACLLLAGSLAGCAAPPRALRWGPTGLEQTLPLARYRTVWMGLPLDNRSTAPITLRAVTATGLHDLRAGRAVVIRLRPDGSINWYPPPGTVQMREEMAHASSVAGFTVPPHTVDRYQVVIPLTATSTTSTGSVTGATAAYRSDGQTFHETLVEHDALQR